MHDAFENTLSAVVGIYFQDLAQWVVLQTNTGPPFILSDRGETARSRDFAVALHHVGIQTIDLANSVAPYEECFGAKPSWTLSRFANLTLERLPGISELTEMVAGSARFHLFVRDGVAGV